MKIALALWAALALWLGSNVGLSLPALMVVVFGGLALLVIGLIARRVRLSVIVVLATWLLIATNAAFYVRFAASLPWLTSYASQTRASHREPRIVGLFRVLETERHDTLVRVITTACMFDDCGLAFAPEGKPPRIGEDSYARIVGGWWRWERSW